jgi:hypothetical protein
VFQLAEKSLPTSKNCQRTASELAEKMFFASGPVTGHGFSRAEKPAK